MNEKVFQTDYYDYELPEELIAQHPPAERSGSRMLVLNPQEQTCTHNDFPDIVDLLPDNAILIVNNTRVLPVRLLFNRPSGGKSELFLLRPEEPGIWRAMARPARKLRVNDTYTIQDQLTITVLADLEDGHKRIKLEPASGSIEDALYAVGEMPLPPYIKREAHDPEDKERYQTVYATHEGSAAAPTAGLHFTESILEGIKARGITIAEVTLHVGAGTFLPVRTDDIRGHIMHKEWYSVPPAIMEAVRNKEQPVIAVGTTSLRALESAVLMQPDEDGSVSGETDLFIYPGYEFKAIDGLLTNFHLPRSTLLMLVCAFAGRDFTLQAYKTAVQNRYRFFSYGDCMLVL